MKLTLQMAVRKLCAKHDMDSRLSEDAVKARWHLSSLGAVEVPEPVLLTQAEMVDLMVAAPSYRITFVDPTSTRRVTCKLTLYPAKEGRADRRHFACLFSQTMEKAGPVMANTLDPNLDPEMDNLHPAVLKRIPVVR